MRYTVNAEQFLELPVTTGTVQNISNTDIEISNEETVGSGLILKAGEMVGFNNTTVYVCARPVLEGGTGIISVVPFSIKGEGGGGEYVLPVATTSKLGGVKSSSAFGKVSVNSDGTMSVNGNPNDGTPTGTVISFFGLTPPTGYLACDGTAYNIADYQALADHINTQFGSYNYFGGDGTTTFAVPDLRGEFLRGTGTNSHANQGSGANVGVHQDGTKQNDFLVYDGKLYYRGIVSASASYDSTQLTTGVANEHHNITPNSYSESNPAVATYTSRPTNTSVLYCIKC